MLLASYLGVISPNARNKDSKDSSLFGQIQGELRARDLFTWKVQYFHMKKVKKYITEQASRLPA